MHHLNPKQEDRLFINRVEFFYEKEAGIIDYDTFKKCLSENKRVSAYLRVIKLLYNKDRTKLRLVIYDQTKRFVFVPNLKRVVPKKSVTYVGVSIDLKHFNVYSYTILKNLKTRKSTKTIRCNDFLNMAYYKLNDFTLDCVNKNKEFLETLLSALNLPQDNYSNISDILFSFYLKQRNIEYYNIQYLAQFRRIFRTTGNKFKNTCIFEITRKLLNLSDIGYVKYFFTKSYNPALFHHMSICDYLKIDYSELNKYEWLYDENRRQDYVSEKTERIIEYVKRLKPYYKIDLKDIIEPRSVFDLELLYYFLSFNKRVNIEHFKSINKIRGVLSTLIECMNIAKTKNGFEIYNTKSLDYLQKYFNPDDYLVNYTMDPSKHLKNEYVLDNTNAFYAIYTIMRADGEAKKFKFYSSNPNAFELGHNYSHTLTNNKKIKKMFASLKNNLSLYLDLFFVESRFCEKDFVVLCEDKKINHIKYISNL